MPFALLAPLALAAAAFIAVPWYLHHIRRPEREQIAFSSLLFIPDVKREVIERRRLQHLLLLLLRMAILVLLSFAFARPFIPLLAATPDEEDAERHVVLIDTSYSMAAGDAFDAARRAALEVIDGLNAVDRVAVVAFAERPQVLAPLSPPEDARWAVDAAQLSFETTDYESALRRATSLLTEDSTPRSGRLVLHLISDFQRGGMPKESSGWRTPDHVDFRPVDIETPVENWAVSDLTVRETRQGPLQLRAKLRNWSPEGASSLDARLVIGDKVQQTQTVDVEPGNATQVRFDYTVPDDTALAGWIEVDDGALATDNRRFFAWQPREKQRVLVVGNPKPDKRWPATALLQHALPEGPDSPWKLTTGMELSSEALADADIVILTDISVSLDAAAERFQAYLENGGRALICLGGRPGEALMAALGLHSEGFRHSETSEAQYAMFTWIDFEHPLFQAFSDARFNDFSDLRFYNHALLGPPFEALKVVARFEPLEEGPGPPAIVEISAGKGGAVLWAFPIDLGWTTLPKSPRFVPLLHETLNYLAGDTDTQRTWQIGDRPSPPRPELKVWYAATPIEAPAALETAVLTKPGFLQWRSDEADPAVQVEPVNVEAVEGNPAGITPAEFALRLCSAPIVNDLNKNDGNHAAAADTLTTWEFGSYALGMILAVLLIESWYAARLT
jgi:hypothetical protein